MYQMCIGIHTKQIGLDYLVLAKQVPQFMKTLSKRNSEKKRHTSHKVSQESHIIYYSQSHKLGKEGHVKFHNHTLVNHMSMEQ
jgi:hypothetical protein